MSETVRNNLDYKDYYIDGLSKFAADKSKFVYAGHIHSTIAYPNFKTISSGIDGFYELVTNSGEIILVIADLHLGLDLVDPKLSLIIQENHRMIKNILTSNYKKVVFLGDTFECQFLSDNDIITKKYWFFDWLESTKSKVYFVVGNHDINLSNKNNILRKYILFRNPEAIIDEYVVINDLLFIHSHQFDPLILKFGKLRYYLIYKIGDYLNLPFEWVKILISKFK